LTEAPLEATLLERALDGVDERRILEVVDEDFPTAPGGELDERNHQRVGVRAVADRVPHDLFDLVADGFRNRLIDEHFHGETDAFPGRVEGA